MTVDCTSPSIFEQPTLDLQQLLMWILTQWTATSLLLLAYNQTQRRILSIFRFLQLPQYWTFEWWSQTNVVYMRLHWIGEFYIGSTETTVFLREKSRTHKYKQHVSQQLAFFEPAIKLWCKRDNFYQFCIFFLFVLNVGTLNIA